MDSVLRAESRLARPLPKLLPSRNRLTVFIFLYTVLCGGCIEEPRFRLDERELLDPESCRGCHPEHYQQWSGSMHAYTGVDPLFAAQLRLGQEETQGELGDHCVSCHSPMALRAGVTEDGLNLDEVEPYLRGITCAACHLVEGVFRDHNAGHSMADDGRLRGGIMHPVENEAHDSAYSLVHDRNSPDSSELCGTCHCVWSSNEVHVERTMDEWRETVFSTYDLTRQTCSNCHMRGRDGAAAVTEHLPVRRLHDHSWPGVDTALIDFPEREQQAEMIQRELDSSLQARLCVLPEPGGVRVVVRLENFSAGHRFPSGTAFDRRVWVELRALASSEVLLTSGVVAADEPISSLVDPNLWLMRDRLLDETGEQVHFPWQAASVESETLSASVTSDPADPRFYHYVERSWPIYGAIPDRIELRVRMRAVGLEVLQQLVDRAALDSSLPGQQPTWDLGNTVLVWEGAVGDCVPF